MPIFECEPKAEIKNMPDIESCNDETVAISCHDHPDNFAIIISRYELKLRIFLLLNFKISKADAQDIVQEAFIHAYLSLKTFDPAQKWKTWIYTIAFNGALSASRRYLPESIEDYKNKIQSGCYVEQQAESNINAEKIKKALDALSKKEATLIKLYFFQEFSMQEISAYLNLPIPCLNRRFSAACLAFKAAYCRLL